MTKKETIWRHILEETQNKRQVQFTQKELSLRFGYSLSTIFNALKVPRQLGAVEVSGRSFRLRDSEKLLLLWATARAFQRDIVYTTHADDSPRGIEGNMPPGIIFGGYSAYRLVTGDAPADYDRIIVYAAESDLRELKRRFPKRRGTINVLALKPDPLLSSFGATTPDSQTFVDLWNQEDWYAKEYVEAIKKKMRL